MLELPEDFEEEEQCPDQPLADPAEIRLPEAPPTSAFSRQRHPKFSCLTVFDVHQLEIKLTQQRVKTPLLKSSIEDREWTRGGDIDNTCRTHFEELQASAWRLIVGTEPAKRTEEQTSLLVKYLRSSPFFRDMPPHIVQECCEVLELRAHEPGSQLYGEREIIHGLMFIMKGRVTLLSGVYTVLKNAAEAPGIRATRCKGFILGAEEFISVQNELPTSSQPERKPKDVEVKEELRHLWSAFAEQKVEILFLPVNKLLEILETADRNERIAALRIFPATRNMPESRFYEPARVKVKGKEVPLHRLFENREVHRHQTLYVQGEKYPVKEAQIMLVTAGEVVLKVKGLVYRSVSDGTVIGLEALRGERYQHTAICVSAAARVLSISVAKYVAQFQAGRFQAADGGTHSPDPAFGRWKLASWRSDRFKQASQAMKARQELREHRDCFRQASQAMRVRADREALREHSWKVVEPRQLPQRVAPLDHVRSARRQESCLFDDSASTASPPRSARRGGVEHAAAWPPQALRKGPPHDDAATDDDGSLRDFLWSAPSCSSGYHSARSLPRTPNTDLPEEPAHGWPAFPKPSSARPCTDDSFEPIYVHPRHIPRELCVPPCQTLEMEELARIPLPRLPSAKRRPSALQRRSSGGGIAVAPREAGKTRGVDSNEHPPALSDEGDLM